MRRGKRRHEKEIKGERFPSPLHQRVRSLRVKGETHVRNGRSFRTEDLYADTHSLTNHEQTMAASITRLPRIRDHILSHRLVVVVETHKSSPDGKNSTLSVFPSVCVSDARAFPRNRLPVVSFLSPSSRVLQSDKRNPF